MTEDSEDAQSVDSESADVPARPDGGHVEWRPWGEAAFEAAAEAGQPVLLSLTASWSPECAEMDGETYGEPRTAAAIDDGFVPVRADVDRQPRVADRYAIGGVPSTVFLTPTGEVLNAAGPLSPTGMRGAIEGVRRSWEEKGAEAGSVPREVIDQEPPGGDVADAIESHMAAVLRENYDERTGGWGTGAKFPLPRTVEFALKREPEMATRTLSAIEANLLDGVEGGFHRSAAKADWSGLQHEKLLDTNATLVRAFANAYRYTGQESFRDAAARGVEYLTTTLWTNDAPGEGGAFAASQSGIGGEEYFGLEATERASAEAPPVDDTVLADWNALGIDALLTYAGLTDDESAREFARRALETVETELIDDGRVVHYAVSTAAVGDGGDDAPAADADGTGSERGLLLDHARTIRALVAARSVLGTDAALSFDPIETAQALADYALDELRPGESFVDGPAEGVGLLDRPLRPLGGNAELAGALLDLEAVTGDERYGEAAHDAIAAFAGAHERFGPQAAHFASVAARVRHGTLRIDVTTPAGSDLHRAALRVADHEAIVVPDATDRRADYEDGAAYVVGPEGPSDPATNPAELESTIAEMV